jgi:outer membrane protein
MRKAVFCSLLVLVTAAPLLAQRRVDLLIDAEGVRRTGSNFDFTPGTRFDPRFKTGGGLGVGLNWFLSDRVSVELKAAGVLSKASVRTVGSDFVATSDLGSAQIYPLTALLQWHMNEHGAIRPYGGAGAGHIILRNIGRQTFAASGVRFEDPTGLVLDGGFEFRTSKRLGFYADARYVAIESTARAQFVGTQSSVAMHVRPLIVSFGIAYHR